MNVLIAGQKEFGAEAFRLCMKMGHSVCAVACPILNGRGDGPDRLLAAARTHGVPAITSGLSASVMPPGVDLIIAAHSHDFIGQRTRTRSRLGAIGYHPSLLPRHRGRDAIRWAIKMGDPVTGGSIYWLNEVMDGGDIAAQDWCWIEPGETADSLWRKKLFPMGIRLLAVVLKNADEAFLNKEKQNTKVATFEPAMNPPRVGRPDLLGIPYWPRIAGEKAICQSATPA